MSTYFTTEYIHSMERIRLSGQQKEALVQTLLQKADQTDPVRRGTSGAGRKTGGVHMRKLTFKKAAAAVAACVVLSGVTAVASGQDFHTILSWSDSRYEYTSYDQLDKAAEKAGFLPDTVETFANGFSVDGINIVHASGQDDAGSTVRKWKEIQLTYQNGDGVKVHLDTEQAANATGDGSANAHEARVFDGIAAYYTEDTYLFVPPGFSVSEDDLAREAADPHFFISVGSDQVETSIFRHVTFIKNDIYYMLSTRDNVGADTLFEMAAELIAR